MTGSAMDVAFSPAVKAWQERMGSRAAYARADAKGGWRREVTEDLAAFIAARDSFYLATASVGGQPYIQHRGGPKGVLKMIDDRTLGFADFGGNKQFITAGNLSENDKAQIFLMDYANRQRIKIWGRARVVEDDPGLLERLSDAGYPGRPERAVVFEIDAWDVNCPQHIMPRFTEEEIAPAFARLEARILELEAELERLRPGTR